MHGSSFSRISLGFSVLLGCSGPARGSSEASGTTGATGSSSGPGTGSDGEGSEASSGSTSAGEGTTSAGDEGPGESGSGVRLDVAPGATSGAGEAGDEGCEKVDFLFVIDNSGSMGMVQQQLIDSFDGFVGTIQTQVAASEYNIMIVDSDSDGCNWLCDELGPNLPNPPDCNGFNCGSRPAPTCETELGSGKTTGLDGTACGIEGGRRYMIRSQPNLVETFACVARVGVEGDSQEQPMGAMVGAVGTALNGPGGCNEGFLRDDAILVVTLVTNSPPGTAVEQTEQDPRTWYDALVNAKAGNLDAIAVLGLVGNADVGGLCTQEQGQGNPQIRDFVGMFGTRGLVGSVCEASYDDFFARAVSLVDTACNDFVPPG